MRPPGQLPNIVLVVMDTAAARRCSVYGHSRPTTPGLERLARDGVLYRHCFATAPWTTPSHNSLFSGLYPSELGAGEKVAEIPEVFYTLPEVLSQVGYHTVEISCNGLVGYQRGFDSFYEMDTLFISEGYHQDTFNTKFIKKLSDRELGRMVHFLKYIFRNSSYLFPFKNILDRLYKKYCVDLFYRSSGATKRSFKIAKHLINKYQGGKPLFLFINLMETHWKYNPPPSYNNIVNVSGRERKEMYRYGHLDYYLGQLPAEFMEKIYLLYDQALAFLDAQLFDFYQFLDSRPVKDNTLFIVTSDHGESLGERGLWGHLFGLYNETLHIPLLIKYPPGLAPPGESGRLVQLNDLYATILEAVEAPLPLPESSRSLLSAPREYALAEHYHNVGLQALRKRVPDYRPQPYMQPCRAAVAADLFKLIQWADGRRELYDLNRDPGEQRNLAADLDPPPRLAALEAVLEEKLGPFGGRD
jgi:arylsulfatase A-like enzyme